MAAGGKIRRWRLGLCLAILAAPLLLALVFSLLEVYSGWLVFAAYPGPVEFMGNGRLFGTTYVSVKWVSDSAVPGPCPLVVHLGTGDFGAN